MRDFGNSPQVAYPISWIVLNDPIDIDQRYVGYEILRVTAGRTPTKVSSTLRLP